MKVTKKKVITAVISTAFIAGFIGIGTTYSSIKNEDSAQNDFKTGLVKCSVDETFTTPVSWSGGDYPKDVKVKNESTVNALIRVAIIPRWVNSDGTAFAGDTTGVTFTGQSDNWIKDESSGYYYYKKIVPKDQSTDEIIKSVKADIPEDLKTRYDGKKLIIDVKAEAVMAKQDAYQKSWSNIGSQEVINLLDGLCGE